MNPITQKMLENKVDYINKITDNPATQYTMRSEGEFKANIGNYHLYWANGGLQLQQMMNDAGGVHSITYGVDTKRELMGKLDAFISGIQVAA